MTIISTMYPQDIRDGMISAGKTGDHAAIDAVTTAAASPAAATAAPDTAGSV
ncbi:MAG: hypothetical protein KA185_17775 [Vitreoscilla sp.]|nr:hypothetical protein [Vitreoscilla sp.]